MFPSNLVSYFYVRQQTQCNYSKQASVYPVHLQRVINTYLDHKVRECVDEIIRSLSSATILCEVGETRKSV